MWKIAISSFLLLFLAPLAAWADASDTDYPNDDDTVYYTCDDFCARVTACETPCVETDCATFCEQMPSSLIYCTELTDCPVFNACVCESDDDTYTLPDDDSAGDDDDDDAQTGGDDDNDNNNDDNGGCRIAGRSEGAGLTFVMLAVGLSALALSLRKSGR